MLAAARRRRGHSTRRTRPRDARQGSSASAVSAPGSPLTGSSGLPGVRAALTRSQLFARVNPLHRGSRDEVERLLELGVRVLMLPMFETAEAVARFCTIVSGRATVVPLLETRGAAEQDRGDCRSSPDSTRSTSGSTTLRSASGLVIASRSWIRRSSTTFRRQCGRRPAIRDRRDRPPRRPTGCRSQPDLLYARYVQLGASARLARPSVRRRFGHGRRACGRDRNQPPAAGMVELGRCRAAPAGADGAAPRDRPLRRRGESPSTTCERPPANVLSSPTAAEELFDDRHRRSTVRP